MNKLLALLLLSPMAFAEPSKETLNYLGERSVSLLTYGLDQCKKTLNDERLEKQGRISYLYLTSNYCEYIYDIDKIRLTVSVMDIEGLYKGFIEESDFNKLVKTGELSLDNVQLGCQKISEDLFTLGMALTDDRYANPFTQYFMNSGMIQAGTDQEKQIAHIEDMFTVRIKILSSKHSEGRYTCDAYAEDKKYSLFDKINFAVKKD